MNEKKWCPLRKPNTLTGATSCKENGCGFWSETCGKCGVAAIAENLMPDVSTSTYEEIFGEKEPSGGEEVSPISYG